MTTIEKNPTKKKGGKIKVKCFHYDEEGHAKDQCPQLKKEKGKDKVKAKRKVRNLKVAWDDTSSS